MAHNIAFALVAVAEKLMGEGHVQLNRVLRVGPIFEQGVDYTKTQVGAGGLGYRV